MRKKLSISIFLTTICLIGWILYSTGQEHTLIVNNNYKNKDMSTNIVIKISGQKDKKIGKNKKAVFDLKGVTHKFSILANEKEIEGVINFKMNKSGELEVEKFLNNEESWLKTIDQY
ncbi:MAG: DUF6672 family protein [Cetobacterium sp.]|uniref:DUF6672 family protein n=1 Tax=Cetobacterium sp. TaxID=2071632 RepID=UPI003F3DE6F3